MRAFFMSQSAHHTRLNCNGEGGLTFSAMPVEALHYDRTEGQSATVNVASFVITGGLGKFGDFFTPDLALSGCLRSAA